MLNNKNILENKLIDLTHTLSPDIPTWDGSCGFEIAIDTDYKDCTEPNLFRTQKVHTRAGIGTHIDAPAHCVPNEQTVDQIPVEKFITNCVVIRKENADESYVFSKEDVENFEKENGLIPENAFVVFSTGWDRFWGNKIKYRNDLKFPSIHEDVAKLLIEKKVVGIGVDTLSPDAKGEDFPVHRVMLKAGKYIVENIKNSDLLPSIGAKIIIMPMKIKDGTEAPLRIVALI